MRVHHVILLCVVFLVAIRPMSSVVRKCTHFCASGKILSNDAEQIGATVQTVVAWAIRFAVCCACVTQNAVSTGRDLHGSDCELIKALCLEGLRKTARNLHRVVVLVETRSGYHPNTSLKY
jgi:hypothetical protein